MIDVLAVRADFVRRVRLKERSAERNSATNRQLRQHVYETVKTRSSPDPDGTDTRVFGGDGDDWLVGGSGRDLLVGGAGADRLLGRGGDDVLSGGSGSDLLWGGAGSDILIGGSDRDRLWGGSGSDLLIEGTSEYEESVTHLESALEHWTEEDLVEALIDLGELGDDGVRDLLNGGSSSDEIVSGEGDRSRT